MKTIGNFLWLVNFLIFIWALQVNCEYGRHVVHTSLGKMVGTTVHFEDTVSNQRIEVKKFLAVPYAKAPIGNLRFRKPEPMEPWGDDCTLDCFSMPNACMQYMETPFPWAMDPNANDTFIDEDCLYMNIWVPNDASSENKKSVFFYVHGGGFFTGSARQTIYDGQVLAGIGDIIVVTINYRLGTFGFWSNNGTDAPGNVAIWDIIEALKWVNNNIESFGGDKDSITVGGESAAGVLVSMLAITPHASGLYKRQIVQSGTAMWSLMDDANAGFTRGQQVSEKVGCANDSFQLLDHPGEVAECMRGIDALTLIKAEMQISPGQPAGFLPRWQDELFPRNPREVLSEGNFPFAELFIGNSGHEGSCFITTGNQELFGFYGEKNPTLNRSTAESLIRQSFIWFPDLDKLVKQYLPEVDSEDSNSLDWRLFVADALGDFIVQCPTVYYASVAGQSGTKVYYYDFKYNPKNSVWAKWVGATHFDEIDFIFGGPFKSQSRYPQAERTISKMVMTHWSNFVKNGKPSEEWPLYADRSETLVYTGEREPTLARGPHGYNCRFWRDYISPSKTIDLPDYFDLEG